MNGTSQNPGGIKVKVTEQEKAIETKIRDVLTSQSCTLAVLFGSFVEDRPFRDIDIMVAMEGGRPPTPGEVGHLIQLLENATGKKVDVVGIDVPSILLRAEIAKKGVPIIMKDADLWDDFRFYAWIDEMDFRPLIEEFYEERFGIKQK